MGAKKTKAGNSGGAKHSKQDWQDLYRDIKENGKDSKYIKNAKKGGKDGAVVSGLLLRALPKMSEGEFLDVLKTGEMPPIKLSKDEMQVLRGGGAFDFLFGQEVGRNDKGDILRMPTPEVVRWKGDRGADTGYAGRLGNPSKPGPNFSWDSEDPGKVKDNFSSRESTYGVKASKW